MALVSDILALSYYDIMSAKKNYSPTMCGGLGATQMIDWDYGIDPEGDVQGEWEVFKGSQEPGTKPQDLDTDWAGGE